MRNMIKTVVVAAAVAAGGWARAPRPSCASSRRSRRSPISAARWAATGSTSRRCRAGTRTRTSSRRSRRWCSRSTAPTRWSTSGWIWRSAGCRRWCSSRATGRSSAGNRATSTRRRRSAPRTSRTCRPISCARSGDIHPLGNPHYWIPPKNARAIARLLAERFTALDAERGGHVQGRARALRGAAGREGEGMGSRGGAAARARGSSRSTRAGRTSRAGSGLEEVGYIEPKPGIPPTANHTAQLVELMKKIGRAAGRRRVVLPEHDGEVRRRQRQGPPGRCALERRRDARDQDLLRPGRRGDRGAQGRLTLTRRGRGRGRGRRRRRRCTSASLHSLNVAPVV